MLKRGAAITFLVLTVASCASPGHTLYPMPWHGAHVSRDGLTVTVQVPVTTTCSHFDHLAIDETGDGVVITALGWGDPPGDVCGQIAYVLSVSGRLERPLDDRTLVHGPA